MRDRLAGRLVVSGFPMATAALLPRAIARLTAVHPGLKVQLTEAPHRRSWRRCAADERRSPSSQPATDYRATTWRACASPRYAAPAAPGSRSRNYTPSPPGNRSSPASSQTRDGSSGPIPATPPSLAHSPASPSQGSPSQPATGPRDSGSSPPVSGSPWCPASPPRRCRATCAGSRSMTTPAGSGGPSGRRPMTIRAQPRPPWSTPWRKRPVPRRATVHRIGLIGSVTLRVWPADLSSSEFADRHRDDKHDREATDDLPSAGIRPAAPQAGSPMSIRC
jgi:hypothetical protein